MTPPGGYLLGFDIGGTRLKSGVVAPDGSVDRVTLDDTDRGGFEDTVLPLLRDHARRHLEATGPGCIGIGIALPGIVETSFGSRYLPGKVLGIEDFPLRESLEAEFGVPVACTNDGAAATLAEWRFGAAKGVEFDRAFLNLMIQHHTGALKMVDDLFAAPPAGQEVDVSVFANDVMTTQTGELGIMRRLLTQLPPK